MNNLWKWLSLVVMLIAAIGIFLIGLQRYTLSQGETPWILDKWSGEIFKR